MTSISICTGRAVIKNLIFILLLINTVELSLTQQRRKPRLAIYLIFAPYFVFSDVVAALGIENSGSVSYCWAGSDSTGTEKYLRCEDIKQILSHSPSSTQQNFKSDMLRLNLGEPVMVGVQHQD
jgi:hypothetical protein